MAIPNPVGRVVNPRGVAQGQRVYRPTHKKMHKAKPKVGKGEYVKAPLLRDKVVQPRWMANAAINNPANILAGGAIGTGGGILIGNKKKIEKADRDRTKNAAAGALIGGGTGHFGRVGAQYGAKATAERQLKPLTNKGNYGPYKDTPHKPALRALERNAGKAGRAAGSGKSARIKAEHFDRHFPKGVPSYRARQVIGVLDKKPVVAGAVLGTAAVGAGIGATRKVKKDMGTSAFGVEHGDDFSKKAVDPKTGKEPSTGRRILASAPYTSAVHPFVAGKKGKKLRAGGNQLGGGLAGGIAGSLAGTAIARGNPVGGSVGALGGSVAGSQLGLNRNQRKGYLKKES